MKRFVLSAVLTAVLATAGGYGGDRWLTHYRRERQLAAAKKVEAGLAAQVSLHKIAGADCRVWDVLRHIGRQTEVPLWWDEGGLPTGRDGRAELISVPDLGLPLQTALELVVAQAGMLYYVDGGRIVISAEPLRDKYVVKVYPLPSLAGGNPALENGADDWITVIVTTIGENSWDNVGASGTIEPIPGGLAIYQTEVVHDEIGTLLNQLQPAPPFAFREALVAVNTQERRLEAALDEPCDCQFAQTPFYEAVQDLACRHQIPLAVCRGHLEESAVDWREPISLSLKGISLRSALCILADQVGCCCVPHNGILLITTLEDAGSRIYPKIYDVRDLVHYEEGDLIDLDSLVELVSTIVSPDQWSERSGPGPIETLYPGWMIFSQTEEIHAETAQLLASLRQGLKPGGDEKGGKITLPQSPAEQRIEAALRQMIVFDYTKIPMDEITRDISVLTGLNVLLDIRGLEEVAIHRNHSITCELSPMPLRDALNRLVDDAQPEPLEWFVRDECLVITTRDRGRAEQSLLVLDVRDILGGEHTPNRLDVDGLTDRVCKSVEPSSWDDNGGPGSIAIYRSLLLVRSSRRINELVAEYIQGF